MKWYGLCLGAALALVGCSGREAPKAPPTQAASAEAPPEVPVMGPEERIFALGDSLFAGYGLQVPEAKHDDLAGLDVKALHRKYLSQLTSGEGGPAARAKGLAAVVAALPKDAPHPNAGKLLFDFLLSDEGQKIYAENEYNPVNPNVLPKDPTVRPDGVKLRAWFMNPEGENTFLPRGMAIAQELFK